MSERATAARREMQALKPDLDTFLSRFEAFGAEPSVDRYLELFHPDGTVFDAGMERPLPVPEIAGHIATILAAVPDFCFRIHACRARGDTVFVEAANRGSLGGSELAWDSVYGVTLAGDRVLRGRRYYDRRPLLSRLMLDLPAPPRYPPTRSELGGETGPPPSAARFVDAYARLAGHGDPRGLAALLREGAAFHSPVAERPLEREEIPGYHAWLLGLAGGRFELVDWAGDEDLLYLEWQIHGGAGGPGLRGVDRFALGEGGAREGRSYFDSVGLPSGPAVDGSGAGGGPA